MTSAVPKCHAGASPPCAVFHGVRGAQGAASGRGATTAHSVGHASQTSHVPELGCFLCMLSLTAIATLCSIKLVDQRSGEDLDPNNLKYRPREGGGPQASDWAMAVGFAWTWKAEG